MAEAQTWRETCGRYVLGVTGGVGGNFADLWYFAKKTHVEAKINQLFDEGRVTELHRFTHEGKWLSTETRMKLDV